MKKLNQFGMRSLRWLLPDSSKGFKFLDSINRSIIPSQVTRLANSIIKMGCVRPIVVADLSSIPGFQGLYIIDGQHLFQALLRLGLEMPYVTIAINSKEELVKQMALLNASSKSWILKNYIDAWRCIKGDYVKLTDYANVFDFEITILAAVLSNLGGHSSGNMTNRIKRGEFNIINEAQNVQLLKHLTEALAVVKRGNRSENRYFCSEFVKYYRNNNYNHQKVIKFLKDNKEKFTLAITEEGKIVDLFNSID